MYNPKASTFWDSRFRLRAPLFRVLLISIFSIIALLSIQYLVSDRYLIKSQENKSTSETSTLEKIIPVRNKYHKTPTKGVIVVLARNSDANSIRPTIRQLEDRWNKRYHYPYVFLNDVEFSEEFKVLSSALTESETFYGVVPKEMWSYPEWINVTLADESREAMEKTGVIYGGSLSYRHMCRFYSGFFFRHPLLEPYDWYWRVEPSVDFSCDIDYDPFLFMQERNLIYGFTISLYEFESTIQSLWSTVNEFKDKYPEYVNPNNALKFITNDDGSYNLCHFWSNFEIGNLNFWRSERYIKFFEFLDRKGGFFYERWGDAPVHSIALLLFLEKSEIHFFNDIAYNHPPYQHCPTDRQKFHNTGRCHCNPNDNFDLEGYSCTGRWFNM